jgi:ketosteroid isomerase-like protein
MKRIGVVLLAGVSMAIIYGQATKPTASGTAEAIKQLERDWAEAQKAVNIDRLSQIVADDWSGLGTDGAKSGKGDFLEDVKSGKSKLESIEFGPMDVKVFGTIAVVQGSDTEKSTTKGENTSGKWVWMDVFVNRGGKWQAVRSQSARVR